MIYFTNILYVGFLEKIVYTSSSKNCFIGQTKKTGDSGKDRLDHQEETAIRSAYGFKQICEQGEWNRWRRRCQWLNFQIKIQEKALGTGLHHKLISFFKQSWEVNLIHELKFVGEQKQDEIFSKRFQKLTFYYLRIKALRVVFLITSFYQ